MTTERVVLVSLSAAMDGGFTAVADVSKAMTAAGAADDYRLIGGVTVMLRTDEGPRTQAAFLPGLPIEAVLTRRTFCIPRLKPPVAVALILWCRRGNSNPTRWDSSLSTAW